MEASSPSGRFQLSRGFLRGGVPSAGLRAPRLTLVLAGIVAAMSMLPLAFVLGTTVLTPPATIASLLLRGRVAELLLNTTLLMLLAVPLCVGIGGGLAWITERSSLPGRRVWAVLAAAPLAVPAFVQSYAWTSVFPGMHGLWAAVFLSAVAYSPFTFLPIAATLRTSTLELEEVASSLGIAPVAVFARVTLPQIMPAAIGGALLVGLHLLAEYGLYAMLRYDTFTTAIVDQFQSSYNGPAANMMASVLVLLSVALLLGTKRLNGRRPGARVGSGATRLRSSDALRWKILIVALFPIAFSMCTVVVPLVTVARWMAQGNVGSEQLSQIATVLRESILLGACGAFIAVAAAWPISRLSIRAPSPLVSALEQISYSVAALPGIVVALGLAAICLLVAPTWYQTWVTLLIAYVVMFLPRAMAGLRGSLTQIRPELEWVAASLGNSPLVVLRRVTLRLAAPGIAAGAALVCLAIVNELTATLLLAPIGTRTLATQFWSLAAELDYAAAAPYAGAMILLSSPVAALLYVQSFRAGGR